VGPLELVKRVPEVSKHALDFRGSGYRSGDGPQKRVAQLKNPAG
jgi:hypothetical protein